MSAFIVSKSHVAAIVRWYMGHTYADAQERHKMGPDWQPKLCGLLYAENVRSVNHRYEDHTPEEPEVFRLRDIQQAPALPPVAVLKLVDSLEYQSCETDDYRTTDAFKALDRIRGAAISSLPGYDAAEWAL